MEPKETRVIISGDTFQLQGVLHEPAGEGRRPGVVVCHPHPRYGGDMDNVVVVKVASALVQRGIVALRFNFRDSSLRVGEHPNGGIESADIRAALSFLEEQPHVLPEKLGLVGYSFGASHGIRVTASDERVKAFAGISLPILTGGYESLPAPFVEPSILASTKPRLFIVGEHDEFSPLPLFHQKIRLLRPPVQIEVIPGADHFWYEHTRDAAGKAAEFMEETLVAARHYR